MDALGFAILGVGAYLIYSAYKGVSPLTHAKSVLAASASPAATGNQPAFTPSAPSAATAP